MGLRVYSAFEASRSYENSFFREFASNLAEMFNVEGLDGILIGFPDVPNKRYLQPDCILATSKHLVLIDFKNHDKAKIWFSESPAFENNPWRRQDGVIIDGGSSINPFQQLKKQKKWIEELIGFDTYGKHGISCVVCFQGNITIMNEVPGVHQPWFSVTNGYQYINKVRDEIGVKNNVNVDVDEILSYFDVKPYRNFYPVRFDDIEAASEANERSAEADRREFEANEKVKEYESKIKQAESEKKEASELKEKLKKAKIAAEEAKEAADDARREFDEKRHTLELATQAAIKAQADAEKAKAEEKNPEIDASISYQKNKTKVFITVVAAVLMAFGLAIGVWDVIRDAKQAEDEKVRLEEDYRNGRTCIPVEKVADYVEIKGVCVDFYATYINDSPNYVFIDNTSGGNFLLMIPKDLISEAEALAKYLNQHIEARGKIEKYKDKFEIIITDLSQIKIIE